MKKFLIILTALMLLFSVTLAEGTEPTVCTALCFDTNETTGYQWTAFLVGGDAVSLPDNGAGHTVTDANPENLDGVGGKTYFILVPEKPGKSLVAFYYGRPWESEILEEKIYLVTVAEDLTMGVMDVTDGSVIEGTVTEVNEAEQTILLNNEERGDIVVTFDSDVLPMAGERVKVYTDGLMTMSLPPIMNGFAWGTVPGEMARD